MLLTAPTVRDLERITARVLESSSRSTGARFDAYRLDGTFFIDIDLPGVDTATIDLTVDDNVLTVRAERQRAGSEDVRVVIAERPMGTFSRQVDSSERLDTDRLDARYDNGVLTLRIPVLARDPRESGLTVGAA